MRKGIQMLWNLQAFPIFSTIPWRISLCTLPRMIRIHLSYEFSSYFTPTQITILWYVWYVCVTMTLLYNPSIVMTFDLFDLLCAYVALFICLFVYIGCLLITDWAISTAVLLPGSEICGHCKYGHVLMMMMKCVYTSPHQDLACCYGHFTSIALFMNLYPACSACLFHVYAIMV